MSEHSSRYRAVLIVEDTKAMALIQCERPISDIAVENFGLSGAIQNAVSALSRDAMREARKLPPTKP